MTKPKLKYESKGYLITHYNKPNGRKSHYNVRNMYQEDFDWFTKHKVKISSEELTTGMFTFYGLIDDNEDKEVLVLTDKTKDPFEMFNELRKLLEIKFNIN